MSENNSCPENDNRNFSYEKELELETSRRKSLEQKLSELQAENDKYERQIEDLKNDNGKLEAELKEAWSFSSKNGTQAREAERQIEVLRKTGSQFVAVVCEQMGNYHMGIGINDSAVESAYKEFNALLSPAPSKPDERNCKIHNDFVFRFGRPHCNPCNRYLDEPAPSDRPK